ncbi:MAG: hypothetical protein ACKESB_01990 [Candidatus Hodgkinia cicadicola]
MRQVAAGVRLKGAPGVSQSCGGGVRRFRGSRVKAWWLTFVCV